MESEYGNLSWEIFVYSTFAIVAICLILYTFFSLKIRRHSIHNMNEEGFFDKANEENNSFYSSEGNHCENK
ncbi:hypothetical protein QEJ31_08920 [Pigmentibacter sp. JX0631]|uniref:hypothetical protein n=1 Tax=Pigmentibacter sp. JX0631 TaxID=2976982 RepID=UPI0024683FE6|nr:hypothetical protein [Pigmentibacter sp. JX0631]WGL58656.1 hypothetical protein QEJ31_08920 [Pigmentibacter sp. JX0631]